MDDHRSEKLLLLFVLNKRDHSITYVILWCIFGHQTLQLTFLKFRIRDKKKLKFVKITYQVNDALHHSREVDDDIFRCQTCTVEICG